MHNSKNKNIYRNLQSALLGRGHDISDSGNLIDTPTSGYYFQTGVVIDVVSAGGISFLKKKTSQDPSFIDSINPALRHLFNKLAPNTLIVKVIDNGEGLNSSYNQVAFPFFSPHLAMPIKPGEYVWLLKEIDNSIEGYYWISRKHGIDQVDDVNYTFLERSNVIETKIEEKIRNKSAGKKKSSQLGTETEENDAIQMHSYLTGQLIEENINNNISDNRTIVKNANDFLDRFAYELVPKISKNPGDIILQGSNNSFIHLTTEKFKNELQNDVKFNEPAIDICINRKKSQLQSIYDKQDSIQLNTKITKSDDTNSNISSIESLIGNEEEKIYELNKTTHIFENINDDLDYFDQSPLNCGGRIYLSNNCTIDDIFDIKISNLENKSGSSIATFSDHNRMFSSKTILITNSCAQEQGSYISINEDGNILLGSRDGDVTSAGNTTGLQPFVRGDDLESLLKNFMTEVSTALNAIATGMQSAVGLFGMPIISLQVQAPIVQTSKGAIDVFKTNDLPKIKSGLIKGE
jgi:hypothetical protein